MLITAGAALRLIAVLAYRPAALPFTDSQRYLNSASGPAGIFGDPFGPGGYAAFLRVVTTVVPDISVVVIVQHLLGLASAIALYLAMRRIAAPRATAAIPAAVLLFNGDQIYLEHTLLSESVFNALLAFGLAAAFYGVTARPDRAWRWATAAAALLAGASLVRVAALPTLPLLMVWLLWASPRPHWRWREVLTASAAAVVVLGGYVAAAELKGGYDGFGQTSGWNLYARVGQFADCSKFTPPAGTAALCERRPIDERWGASYYLFDPQSPAIRAFGRPPAADGRLRAFALAAIRAQPGDYVDTVATDTLRYFDAQWGPQRPFSGSGFEAIAFARRAAVAERPALDQIDRFYGPEPLHVDGSVVARLGDYQDVARFGGLALFASLLLGAVALAFGDRRRLVVLPLAVAITVLMVPVLTHAFVARYIVPASVPLGIVAAFGVWAIVTAVGRRRGRTAPGDATAPVVS